MYQAQYFISPIGLFGLTLLDELNTFKAFNLILQKYKIAI
jgi:hypothetical protein